MPVYSEVFTGPICHSQAHSFIRFASDTMQYRRRRDCCLLFNMFWSPVRSNDKFRPKSIQFAIQISSDSASTRYTTSARKFCYPSSSSQV
jgi:hypothetical protein